MCLNEKPLLPRSNLESFTDLTLLLLNTMEEIKEKQKSQKPEIVNHEFVDQENTPLEHDNQDEEDEIESYTASDEILSEDETSPEIATVKQEIQDNLQSEDHLHVQAQAPTSIEPPHQPTFQELYLNNLTKNLLTNNNQLQNLRTPPFRVY